MSNINDYLLWRGDLSFEKSPFNQIDDMVLARFSYMPFNKIKMEETETIESIYLKLKSFKNEDFGYNGDKDLITRLGQSIRFKNLKVTNFEINVDKKAEEQFSAITVHIDENKMYISFNGTDSSIIGWKEDFNLSFMENIPSQIAGLEYAKNVMNKYLKKVKIGGHSKGGNIAMYSAIGLPHDLKDRVISVSNYDGPGFTQKMVESENYKNILNKITTYIPQSSIIGRLLEHRENCIVIESTEKGIYQHDIFSWQVLGTNVVTIRNVTNDSDFFDKTISTWLQKTAPEQRKIFIDTVFELFDATNVLTFKEFSTSKIKNINTILKSYSSINEDEKKILSKMIFEFLSAGKKNAVELFKKK